MVGRIYHVGLTVSDLDRSVAFYRDILGLEFQGEIFMEGEETDKMFRKEIRSSFWSTCSLSSMPSAVFC